MIVTDRETWDRWNETGEWVLFASGHRDDLCLNTHPEWVPCPIAPSPPVEFVEWAKPCETCLGDGWWWCDIDSDEHIRQRCGSCLDGKRRIAVAVPCMSCSSTGSVMRYPVAGEDDMVTATCDLCLDGLVTVGHVVVEWGPARVVETLPAAPDYECIELVRHKTFRRSALLHFRDGGRMRSRFVDLPPDIDPATLVGKWAQGYRKVVAKG